MPQWMQDLFAGWPMIRANLPTFFVLVVLVFGAAWWLMDWRYGSIVANRDSEIALLKGQRDDYKEKLSGASPDQAKAKIETLEKTIALTIGARWEPLTRSEIDALSARLGTPASVRVQIMYESALGKDLAQSFYDAFKAAGWNATFSIGSGLGPGVTTGQGSVSAVAVKSAIESTSKIKVTILRPDEKEWPGLIFLAVGINAPSP